MFRIFPSIKRIYQDIITLSPNFLIGRNEMNFVKRYIKLIAQASNFL